MTATHAPRTTRRRTAAMLIALLLVGGCGLSESGDPQLISPDRLPTDLLDPSATTSTTRPPTNAVPVTIYLLRETDDGAVLVPVFREITDPTQPASRIEALFAAQPTARELAVGLYSAIPPDVQLLSAPPPAADRELVIDVSEELLTITGSELTQAFAQIVYTAAELDGVRTVRFRVDGEDQPARDGSGSEQQVVDKSDYGAFRPL